MNIGEVRSIEFSKRGGIIYFFQDGKYKYKPSKKYLEFRQGYTVSASKLIDSIVFNIKK